MWWLNLHPDNPAYTFCSRQQTRTVSYFINTFCFTYILILEYTLLYNPVCLSATPLTDSGLDRLDKHPMAFCSKMAVASMEKDAIVSNKSYRNDTMSQIFMFACR